MSKMSDELATIEAWLLPLPDSLRQEASVSVGCSGPRVSFMLYKAPTDEERRALAAAVGDEPPRMEESALQTGRWDATAARPFEVRAWHWFKGMANGLRTTEGAVMPDAVKGAGNCPSCKCALFREPDGRVVGFHVTWCAEVQRTKAARRAARRAAKRGSTVRR
jgi:hypothetical protein